MNSKIKELFPAWVNDNEEKYDLVLSDDVDSLVSCALLNKVKGYKINYFYNFENVYDIDKESNNPAIAVDCDLVKGRCWSNHVTMLSAGDSVNTKSANLNNILKISRDNYFKKFCGSTAIQIWSYYDLPLPETEEGKMALLAIDVGFKGHYDSRFIKVHSKYLNMLGFPQLIEVLERHSRDEFYDLMKKYNMMGKIKLNKNKIITTNIDVVNLQRLFNLDLSRPSKEPLHIVREFKRASTNLISYKTYIKDDFTDLFSLALTYKNKFESTKIK